MIPITSILILAGFVLVAFIACQAFQRTDALVELVFGDWIQMKLNTGSPDPKSGERDTPQPPNNDGSTP